jgi:flavin reductase (DIM6/NTAB) family NADH-FMN oxidoreductase RutF
MPEPDSLDPFVAGLDHPVYIVTTVHRRLGTRAGCLTGFASQCSVEPDRFAVWLSEHNHTYRAALEADVIAVHGLARNQLELASLFGTRSGAQTDTFARCAWREGPAGVPILDECPRWFVGDVLGRMAGGNHTCFLLKPRVSAGPAHSPPPLMLSQVRHLRAAQSSGLRAR